MTEEEIPEIKELTYGEALASGNIENCKYIADPFYVEIKVVD